MDIGGPEGPVADFEPYVLVFGRGKFVKVGVSKKFGPYVRVFVCWFHERVEGGGG